MNTILITIACLTGFLIREVMAIMSRRNSAPPSLSYYWSLPKNRWTLLLNALCTVGVMLGRHELIAVASDEGFAEQWPVVASMAGILSAAPILTAMGIGLFAAFVVRWVITTMDQRFGRSKRERTGDE